MCVCVCVCVCVCDRTKKLVVDVIRIQPGETLPEILETPATAPQVKFSSTLFYISLPKQSMVNIVLYICIIKMFS